MHGELPSPIRPTTENETYLAKTIMQQFATELLGFLDHHGSQIRLFCINPSLSPHTERDGDPDSDGHRWPRYYYTRSRIVDGRGCIQLAASPLACAPVEIPDEMAYSRY